MPWGKKKVSEPAPLEKSPADVFFDKWDELDEHLDANYEIDPADADFDDKITKGLDDYCSKKDIDFNAIKNDSKYTDKFNGYAEHYKSYRTQQLENREGNKEYSTSYNNRQNDPDAFRNALNQMENLHLQHGGKTHKKRTTRRKKRTTRRKKRTTRRKKRNTKGKKI
jgi:viroplasmin and RNaseH domain-containing protein